MCVASIERRQQTFIYSWRSCRVQEERRKPVVWENLVQGSFYVVNNETGDRVKSDRFGKPIPQFYPDISGVATTKLRMSLNLKV